MDDKARDAAEARLLFPLVKRFQALMGKYSVWSNFWHAEFFRGSVDEAPLSMLVNSIENPARVKAYYLGVKDEAAYQVYKDHDWQCRAALATGDRCARSAREGCDFALFDAADHAYQFCKYHYDRIPSGNVRLWTNPGAAVEPQREEEEEADTEAAVSLP